MEVFLGGGGGAVGRSGLGKRDWLLCIFCVE